MLFHLIVQNFINQLLTRQFIGDLAATRKSKLTYNHLKSSHLSRFVYVGKKSLNVRLGEEEVIFILQATALKDTIKLMHRPTIFLVKIALKTTNHSLKKHPFLLEKSLIALFIQNSLKKDKYMLLLIMSQISHRLPKTSLILLSQWLTIFHSKISLQIVRKRTPLLVKTLDLPLRL